MNTQIENPRLSMSAMRQKLIGRSKRGQRFYANDFSVLNPTIWANEALLQLQPNMIMGNLVSRDWDDKVAKFGDIVNVFVPSTFVMTKKGQLCENVVVQDATGSSIQAALDQWPQVSFPICDGEEDRSALDLVDTLLVPAVTALAVGIDRILGSQVYNFLDTVGGHLNGMTSDNAIQYLLETREAMNRKNVPTVGRQLVLSSGTETEALQVRPFYEADKVGDNGTAMREAALGRKFGFDIWGTQTQPEVSTGQAVQSGVTMTSAASAGATTVAITGTVVAGQWASIAGDDTPQHVLSVVSTGVYSISPGLKRSVASGAAVTIVKGAAVNNAAGYVGTTMRPRNIGWVKEILIDGMTANSIPQIGQLVSFGAEDIKYAITALRIIDASAGTHAITLERPLVNPLTDNETVNFGPAGKYNFAFLRNAIALINRPLPSPRAGTGAAASVVSDPINKLSLRVTITYDGLQQSHLVTVDTLVGVSVFDERMGAVLLA